MTMDVAVRSAVVENAGSIARVQIQAWREPYAHLLLTKGLARLQQGLREAKWREIIAAGRSAVRVA